MALFGTILIHKVWPDTCTLNLYNLPIRAICYSFSLNIILNAKILNHCSFGMYGIKKHLLLNFCISKKHIYLFLYSNDVSPILFNLPAMCIKGEL